MGRKIECENLNILKISSLRKFKKQASKNMDGKDGAAVKNACYADEDRILLHSTNVRKLTIDFHSSSNKYDPPLASGDTCRCI